MHEAPNALDALIQRQFPCVVAPRYGELAALDRKGERFIVCATGVKMEIWRPWIHAVIDLTPEGVLRPMPYGPGPEAGATLLCQPIPKAMRERFIEEARATMPSEHAAWVTWNEHTRLFRYRSVQVLSHSPASITYVRPDLDPGEWLVGDIHSHARYPAGFSATDEVDDYGTLQLSLVLGSLDRSEITEATVLRCMGVTLPLTVLRLKEQRCTTFAPAA
jgi:PRTRC genetic system protein A